MEIPRNWQRQTGEARLADGRVLPLSVWGWGDTDAGARQRARERWQRAFERLRRGEAFPKDAYAYGSRPLREEILDVIDGKAPADAAAVITRNAYGAEVLNTARLLFLDIDLPRHGLVERLRRWLRRSDPAEEVLARLREALSGHSQASYRIYRTASGLRVIAVDRDFDPAGEAAQQLMRDTATDPAFARLCRAQKSFRARLTPKPWRCGMPLPPGTWPRDDHALQQRFTEWLRRYQQASGRYASCRYLESIGSGRPGEAARRLIALHDERTRCDVALPLA